MSKNYDGARISFLPPKAETGLGQDVCPHTTRSGRWALRFTDTQAICKRCGYVFNNIDREPDMSFASVIAELQLAKLDVEPDDIVRLAHTIYQLEIIKQHQVCESIVRRGRPSRLYVRNIGNTALLNAADSLMGRDKKHTRTSAIVAIIIATLRKRPSPLREYINISSTTIRDIAYNICDDFTDWVIPDTNSK